MAQQGDDCYYFYYSTCAKGASCPFRHCEAALGNEVTCSLWEQGACYRAVCTYRHMHITKNRSKIQCYWETQPSGCLKPHCVFHHLKPRPMEAGFGVPTPTASETSAAVPPTVARAVMPPVEEPAGVGSPTHVPTPQVAPVVINPFEEAHSSDESSEHGSPRKQPTTGAALRGVVLSTRKIVSSENEEMERTQQDSRVKVKTLQEIRRERMGTQPTGGQNFTQQSNTRQVQVKSFAEIRKQKLMNRLGNKSQQQRVQGDLEEEDQEEMLEELGHVEIKSLAEIRKQKLMNRLGNKSQQQATQGDLEEEDQEGTPEGLGIKSLAEIKREKLMSRLGAAYQKGAENEEQKGQPQVQVKSLADIRREKLQRRLGKTPQESDLPTGEDVITQVQEQGQVKVKTLEEIKRAKLLSRLGTVPEESVQSIAEHDDKLEKQQVPVGIKTLEEIKREKLLRRLGKFQEKREQHKDEIITEKSEVDVQSKEAGSIQIKTLAEIRREKALRNLGGAIQAAKDDSGSTVDSKKQLSPKKLPVSKPDPQAPGGVKKTKGVRRVVVVDPHKVVEKSNTAAGRRSPDAAEKRSNNNVTNRRGVKREMQLYRPPRGKDTGPSLAEKPETSPTKLPVKTPEQKAPVPSRAVEKVQLSRKSPEKAQVLGKSPEKTQQNVPEVKAPEQIKIKTFEEIMREKKLRKQQEETEEPAGKTPEVSPKLARKSSVPSQPLSDSTKGEQPAKKVKLGPSPVKVQPQEPTIVKRGIKRPLATGVPTAANVPVSVGQTAPKKPAVIVPSLSEKTTPSDVLTGDGQALLEEAFAAKKPKIIRAQSPTIPQKTPPPTTPKLQETPTTPQEPPVVTKPAESNTTTSQKPPATDRQESVDLEDFEFDLEGDETDLTALGDADDDSLMAELDEMLNS